MARNILLRKPRLDCRSNDIEHKSSRPVEEGRTRQEPKLLTKNLQTADTFREHICRNYVRE